MENILIILKHLWKISKHFCKFFLKNFEKILKCKKIDFLKSWKIRIKILENFEKVLENLSSS